MIFGPDRCWLGGEVHVNTPPNLVPVVANSAELARLGAFVAMGLGDSYCMNLSGDKREHDIARGDLAHALVEGVMGAV